MYADWPEPEIIDSARKWGIPDDEIKHAIAYRVYVSDLTNTVDDDTEKVLILGHDHAGNRLEVVALLVESGPLVIHAMPMQPKYEPLLLKGING